MLLRRLILRLNISGSDEDNPAARSNPDLRAYSRSGRARARQGRELMTVVERMKARWGVGPGGVVAILAAFSLAGLTTLRLKAPVMGLMFPEAASGWWQWAVYLVVMLPIYQVLLLGYGTLLGQFDFFWSKLKAVGRLVSGRAARASN